MFSSELPMNTTQNYKKQTRGEQITSNQGVHAEQLGVFIPSIRTHI